MQVPPLRIRLDESLYLTQYLTLEQQGVYFKLLGAFWRLGPLSSSEISNVVVGVSGTKLSPVLALFQVNSGGCFYCEELERQFERKAAKYGLSPQAFRKEFPTF